MGTVSQFFSFVVLWFDPIVIWNSWYSIRSSSLLHGYLFSFTLVCEGQQCSCGEGVNVTLPLFVRDSKRNNSPCVCVCVTSIPQSLSTLTFEPRARISHKLECASVHAPDCGLVHTVTSFIEKRLVVCWCQVERFEIAFWFWSYFTHIWVWNKYQGCIYDESMMLCK